MADRCSLMACCVTAISQDSKTDIIEEEYSGEFFCLCGFHSVCLINIRVTISLNQIKPFFFFFVHATKSMSNSIRCLKVMFLISAEILVYHYKDLFKETSELLRG